MRLRQKKTNNLSEEAFYLDFQNQHFQTLNRKLDNNKRPLKDPYNATSSTDPDKSSYAQILVKFISNVKLAKHSQEIRSKSRPMPRNVLREQNQKPKRFRKTSENASFDEQKKVEYLKPTFTEPQAPPRKSRSDYKNSKTTDIFSANKTQIGPNVSQNKKKELSEQNNIINNWGSFNMGDYARFVQSPYFALNQQMMNNWFQMGPFMVPSMQSFPPITEQMKNGLCRQLEIYERFKPQPNPSQIEKQPLPFIAPPQPTEQKTQKETLLMDVERKMSPDKIFKRASYHVGIAYSIYMDNIQKQGKRIKNFADIDPTRFAKKIKTTAQRY